jgi:8-amino-7-oxononanoate synthase
VNAPHAPETEVEGKRVLLFASNSYLNLGTDERVREAASKAVSYWGIGAGSARLLTGNLSLYEELERRIAAFMGREAAITFVAGGLANMSAIPALTNIVKVKGPASLSREAPDTVIFSDQYNHASIINGIKLSGCAVEVYRHVDTSDLQTRLAKYSKERRKLIVSDGVFSRDGDIAPLQQIAELAREYNAYIYLDDAHAIGILGPHGRGTEDYFQMEGACELVMGTFTKAFGGVGGCIVGDRDLLDYLRVTSSGYVFSAPIAPPVACGLTVAIELAERESWRRERLLKNAAHLRERLHQNGFDTLRSETQIVPVLIGNEMAAMEASRRLLDEGIFVPAARWPAVPMGQARLRFTAMTQHREEQIDHAVERLCRVRDRIHF